MHALGRLDVPSVGVPKQVHCNDVLDVLPACQHSAFSTLETGKAVACSVCRACPSAASDDNRCAENADGAMDVLNDDSQSRRLCESALRFSSACASSIRVSKHIEEPGFAPITLGLAVAYNSQQFFNSGHRRLDWGSNRQTCACTSTGNSTARSMQTC